MVPPDVPPPASERFGKPLPGDADGPPWPTLQDLDRKLDLVLQRVEVLGRPLRLADCTDLSAVANEEGRG